MKKMRQDRKTQITGASSATDKISVIIPVYNTANHLDRCLKSIIAQSYTNLEIIIVNDASPDQAQEIIDLYKKSDLRIKSITHNENKGLFQARLSGLDIATGDLISFVDSDDYISVDLFLNMFRLKLTHNADIVCTNGILKDINTGKIRTDPYNTFSSNSVLRDSLSYKEFWRQDRKNYAYHTVWGKLYSIELWDRCRDYFNQMKEHLIFTEDLAFSSVLCFFAKTIVIDTYAGYFYCQHELASTGSRKTQIKNIKGIFDLSHSFTFIETFLISKNIFNDYADDFWETRKEYLIEYCLQIYTNSLLTKQEKHECYALVTKLFNVTVDISKWQTEAITEKYKKQISVLMTKILAQGIQEIHIYGAGLYCVYLLDELKIHNIKLKHIFDRQALNSDYTLEESGQPRTV